MCGGGAQRQADAFAPAGVSPMLRRGSLKATSPRMAVVDDKTGTSLAPAVCAVLCPHCSAEDPESVRLEEKAVPAVPRKHRRLRVRANERERESERAREARESARERLREREKGAAFCW